MNEWLKQTSAWSNKSQHRYYIQSSQEGKYVRRAEWLMQQVANDKKMLAWLIEDTIRTKFRKQFYEIQTQLIE